MLENYMNKNPNDKVHRTVSNDGSYSQAFKRLTYELLDSLEQL